MVSKALKRVPKRISKSGGWLTSRVRLPELFENIEGGTPCHHDVTRKKLEILRPVVSVEKTHRNFQTLLNDLGHTPARDIIKELAYAFVDVDGNYVRDFQTTGFNSRLWELYLFAFLYEQRFSIFNEFKRPDFCVAKEGFPMTIEAVTVNATEGEEAPQPQTSAQIAALRHDYMPIKFGSALYSKLNKKY